MGTLNKLLCKCGYEKDVRLGSGMFPVSEESICQIFSEEQLIPYWDAKDRDILNGLEVVYRLAYCENCADIQNVPVLYIYMRHGSVKSIPAHCDKCGSEIKLIPQDDAIRCPLCNEILNNVTNGFWN